MAVATFAYDAISPIRWVANNASGTNRTYVKSPSKYEYELQDVSAPDAGRTEDAMMHKLRVGQVCKLNLAWQNVTTDVVAALLQMFDPEYLYVNYLDGKTGDYRTDLFYVGDRSAPMYSNTNRVWTNVAFNLIRKDGGTLV